MENLTDFLATPLGMGAAAAIAFAVGALLFKGDTRIEERRRHAIEIAGKLRSAGFDRLPVFFEDYAVSDFSGMLRSLKELHGIFANDEQRRAELQKVLKLLLTDLFRDPEKRPQLLKLIDDLKAANLPDAKSVIGDALGQILGQRTVIDELGDLRGRGLDLIGKFLGVSSPTAEKSAATVEKAPAPPAA